MSLSSNASNVLLAKCRAKFGRHLTEQDVNTMVNCRTISEVTACLKSNEHYGPMLSDVDESSVYRRRIEFLIEQGFYQELSTLCRYELQVGEWFSSYALMKGEIKLIMSFLRQLAAGHPDELIFSLPELFLQRSDIDFPALLECRSFAEFLQIMDKTRFGKVLRVYVPTTGKQPDFAMLEHALYDEFYNTIFEIINKHYSGSARDELTELLGLQLDLDTFSHIYRLKKYYRADPAMIRTMLLGRTTHIGRSTLDALIAAPDADTALEIFSQRTVYRRKLDLTRVRECGIEAAVNSIVYEKALRLLRTSVNPTTVLLSYITLAETETRDIVTIVEGVFYKLSADEIKQLITINC